MSSSGRSARRAVWTSRPGTLGVVLLPLLLAATPALADEIVCAEGRCTMDRARAQQCAVDARLVIERGAELRLRLDDVHELRGLVERTSARLAVTARDLARERGRWPAWAWWLFGVGSGVVGSVVLALSL